MLIKISETEVTMEPPMAPPVITNYFLGTLMGMYRQTIQDAPEEYKEEVREHLYDMFNTVASEFLSQLIPDKDLRPDLTAQAILEIENQILDRQPIKVNEDILNPEILLDQEKE